MRQRLEFIIVLVLVRALGALPRSLARAVGAGVGAVAFGVTGRLRRTGERNLQIAFPESDAAWRARTLRAALSQSRIASRRVLPDVALHPREHPHLHPLCGPGALPGCPRSRAEACWCHRASRPVGAIQLLSLADGLSHEHGDPAAGQSACRSPGNGIRCLHGNTVLHKDDFARGLLGAMRRGDTVGILMDTNMTPPQGVFVDFFGTPACTASGLARVAMRTGAAACPAFLPGAKRRKSTCSNSASASNSSAPATRSRTWYQHTNLHHRHRVVGAALSRTVALGASPMEDTPGW